MDATAGYGGHAEAIINHIGQTGAVLVDRDLQAVDHLVQKFPNAKTMHSDYATAAESLYRTGYRFDMILLDLGVSSPQLDQPNRGFSFRSGGPLDMRMDQSSELSADDVVNGYSQDELARVIWQYGEEPMSRRIAKAIVEARPIHTTTHLAQIIQSFRQSRKSKVNPATRVFQAIRIEVNAEITQLEAGLPKLFDILKPDGRLAVISFHSLEDRRVKNFMAQKAKGCICPPEQAICTCGRLPEGKLLTRGAIKGLNDETNPRARSARLRAIRKLKIKTKESK